MGSDFDTQLHIYTGFESGFVNLIPVANNDDAIGQQSQASFEVTAGTLYEIRVGGFRSTGQAGDGAEGNIVLNGSFKPESVMIGDMNCDGAVNLLDVDPFIEAIGSGEYNVKADTNQDGAVNLLDVDSFIALLNG